MKILIAEDDQTIRNNIRLLLKIEGFEVLTAENGAEGLQMAREHLPEGHRLGGLTDPRREHCCNQGTRLLDTFCSAINSARLKVLDLRVLGINPLLERCDNAAVTPIEDQKCSGKHRGHGEDETPWSGVDARPLISQRF